MISARSAARFLVAGALVGVAPAAAQTDATQGPKTPAELAQVIADTVRATTQVTPGAAEMLRSGGRVGH